MTSSCIWVSRQHVQRLRLILFILCLLYVGKSYNISEANNRGCKHNSARLDKWLEVLAVEGLINTERTVT